jgi:UPF0755 protein
MRIEPIEMPNKQPNSKLSCCAGGLIVAVGLMILLAIVIPSMITSRAEQAFGAASPQLSFRQHLYLSTVILLHTKEMTEPLNPAASEVELTIDQGESVASITQKLKEAGLIPNPGVFSNYLQYKGLDTSLKAGTYQLSPALAPVEVAQAIQSSISADVTLSILPGWRAEEIANSLPSSGLNITSDEFLSAVHTHPDGYSFSECMGDDSLEGYLYPDSYTLPRSTTMAELLTQILANFDAKVTPEIKDGFTAQGLSICQAVTLSSIVEREAMVEDEMPMIASVFYNRLNSGAVLGSDPTVQYALGYNSQQATWWTNPLSMQDLKVDSPYNTYIYPGLPPGPISNPSLAALKAVAFPAETPYYYFRATCDGSGRHVFAVTYDEHLANACP